MPFTHSEPLARTETSVKTAPTTRTIETLVAMWPMPTSGETIPPIKKPDAPMAAAAVPAFVRSAFNAKAVAGGWLISNMNRTFPCPRFSEPCIRCRLYPTTRNQWS